MRRQAGALRVNRLFGLILVVLIMPLLALSDELQPFYIELVEAPQGTFTLDFKTAPGQDNQTATLMSPCTTISNNRRDALVMPRQPTLYRCNDLSKGLVIKRTADGLSPPALIRFKRLSGQVDLYYLKAGDHQQTLYAIAPNQGSFVQYLTLGFDHILMGYDHLLFVWCLVLLASSWRRVLVMVTGFTVAHSMTLGLAVLGVLRAPIALIEVLIAVSILLLAVELAKGPRPTLTHQYPILVSSFFGLLHGLGFAAALTQIGLPSTDVVWALLAFNVGVELGQVGFVLILLAFGAVINQVAKVDPAWFSIGRKGLIYTVGVVAGYWAVDRLLSWIG